MHISRRELMYVVCSVDQSDCTGYAVFLKLFSCPWVANTSLEGHILATTAVSDVMST